MKLRTAAIVAIATATIAALAASRAEDGPAESVARLAP